MERAVGAARADALVGRTPAASTRAVTCAARPRAFHGAWRACARSSAIGDSAATGRRQNESDGCTAVYLAFERQRATMIGHDALSHREPNPNMTGLGRDEGFERSGQDIRCDDRTRVLQPRFPGAIGRYGGDNAKV